MKTRLSICLALAFATVVLGAEAEKGHSFTPAGGYVPNGDTAISIAVAVWTPIYGKERIEQQKPYVATLTNGIWYVYGTLQENMVGGVAIAEISKQDGRILRVSHGR